MTTRRRVAALFAISVIVAVVVITVVRSEHRSPSRTTVSAATQRARTTSSTVLIDRSARRSSVTSTANVVRSAGPPWSVRQSTLDLYDPTRTSPARGTTPAHNGRLLRTTLRWPASRAGRIAPGRLPLIVFAHGYNVSAATYTRLLDNLARAGIVVAAPDFPGESTAYPGPAVESDLANEPCDIAFVAASLERHPPSALRRALTDAPIIVAGHSDGATAAAAAAYASTCFTLPIRAVVALSPDDISITHAYRFGTAPSLLAMTGAADEINPPPHTFALYEHAPTPAWLVTIDGGRHLATFTTDAELPRITAMIADFTFAMAENNSAARARFVNADGGRIHLHSRRTPSA